MLIINSWYGAALGEKAQNAGVIKTSISCTENKEGI